MKSTLRQISHSERGDVSAAWRAADRLVHAIRRRRPRSIAPLLDSDVRLIEDSGVAAVEGDRRVIKHLNRAVREFATGGATSLDAVSGAIPVDGQRYPCVLIYDGPHRMCALCPIIDDDSAASALVVITDSRRLLRVRRHRSPDPITTR